MPIPDDLRRSIDQLAAAQAGHLARWQTTALGLSDRAADDLPARLGATALGRGVARLPGHLPTPAARSWAALLAVITTFDRPTGEALTAQQVLQIARSTFGITGFTAAAALGLVPNPPTRPQILIPHTLVKRVAAVRTIRTRVYPDGLTLVDGVPTVPPLRALWDCGWVLRMERDAPVRLLRLISRADGLRYVEAEHLHLVATDPRAFGLPATVPWPFRVAAFSVKDGHSHSGTEHDARALVTEVAARYGLRVEPRPTDITSDGVHAGEADIAILLLRLDFEIDGPHHRQPAQRADDRRRDGRFRSIDWMVRRYDTEFVHEDPAGFQRSIEQDILHAAALRGVALVRRGVAA